MVLVDFVTVQKANEATKKGILKLCEDTEKALQDWAPVLKAEIELEADKGRFVYTKEIVFGSGIFSDVRYSTHSDTFDRVARKAFTDLGYKVSIIYNDFLDSAVITLDWSDKEE